MVLLLLLKVTLVFSLALAAPPLMRRMSSASRHLLCVCATGAVLLLPLTMLVPAPIRISAITFVSTARPQPLRAVLPLAQIGFVLWAVGAVLLMLRILLGYIRLTQILQTAASTENGFVFSNVSVPMAAGLFRPVILLPRSAASWPPAQIAAALRHERAHIERHDLWTSLLAHLACSVYWFHPLVWAVARRLRDEQETACDDAVLASGFEPASYAEALIATARQTTLTPLIGCHMLTQKTLKSRIARLLENGLPRTSSTTTLRRTAIAFVAAAGLIALLNGAGPADNPINVGDGVSAPKVLYKVDPVYTDEAHDAKISGSVLLSVIVGTDGLAHDVSVLTALDAGLDRKAVEAVQQWRFVPGSKDGQPVAVKAKIEVQFRLV